MKKLIIALGLIATVNFTFAQDVAPKLFHFGLKVAPTLAWMKANTKELKNGGMRPGFSYGLITEFGFTKNYAFGTGIDITYRGGKVTGDYSQDSIMYNYDNIYKFQFIEIPLTLKMKTNMIGPMTYFGQIGVAPGYAIKTKGDIESTLKTIDTAYNEIATAVDNEDVKDVVNKIMISMVISAGAEYNLGGSTNLLVAITFNNGFTNLLKDATGELVAKNGSGLKKTTEFVQKASSNYLALTVGILF